MTKNDAIQEADRINTMNDVFARLIRILPADIDPVIDGDNGWDVEVTMLNKPSQHKPLFGSNVR